MLAFGFPVGLFQIQVEEKGEQVFRVLHAVGGADGGVEGGVGVAEAIDAGGFEGAIEVAQGLAVCGRDLAAQGPQGTDDPGDGAGAREPNQRSGRSQLPGVREVAAVEGAHLARQQGDNGYRLAGQRHELHFIALAAVVHVHDRADIPRHQPFVRNVRGQTYSTLASSTGYMPRTELNRNMRGH